jgi:hypothetical protein
VRQHRSLTDRNKDREEALAKQQALFKRSAARQPQRASSESKEAPTSKALESVLPALAPVEPAVSQQVLVPRMLPAGGGVRLDLQPWSLELATTLLDRAADRKISIRLIWPAEIDTLAGLHAVASLSRVLHTDLKGLKTLYYPGTHATCNALDRLAMDRLQLRHLWQSLYEATPRRASTSFKEVLAACNDVELYNASVPPPQLRQLIPSFIYEPATKLWCDTKHLPLDRLITKVAKLRTREMLRANILPEWRDPTQAPGALLVLPRGLKRKALRQSLARGTSKRIVGPDVMLFDARSSSAAADPHGVHRLPEFLKNVYEFSGSAIGTLIVTDDPTQYFVLKARLEQHGLKPDASIIAGEAEAGEWMVSQSAKPPGWRPAARGMINFNVSILDQDGALLARRFGRIAEAVHEEGASAEEPFRLAQVFVMRVSHLPGGFTDLYSDETEEHDYLVRDLEWSRIEALIRKGLTEGSATEQRKQIDDACARVHKHLADCENATPLAVKLQEQVERFAVESRDGLTIVLSSPRHIAIAQRYLARVLGSAWTLAQTRVDWLTLARAAAELKSRSSDRRLVIVGLSPRILRLLVTHSEIPTGTCLLVPAQKAIGAARTLAGLAASDALKSYRARLTGLLANLKLRLSKIPDIEVLTRSLESVSISPQRLSTARPQPPDPKAYRFLLEDGRWAYAIGNVFRYEGLEGEDFKRVHARSIEADDCIFEMSDEVRDEIEQAITPTNGLVESSPARKILGLYHSCVKNAVVNLFPAASKQASVRNIKARMVEVDPDNSAISLGKLNYWISLTEEDRAPHGARDQEEFLLFCQVLEIEPGLAKTFWERVRRVRFENQFEGRQLNAIYAEILFNPESAQVYRGLSPEIIRRLRRKALDCVFQVMEVEAPQS